jgi:hypothetical protein
MYFFFIFSFLLIFINQILVGQIEISKIDPNYNNDTLYKRRLNAVFIKDSIRIRTTQEEEAYQNLKRKIIKLYPYALMAKQVYVNSNNDLSLLEKKSEKRRLKKEKEKELRNRFENEIKGLYTSDGPILVKLIHRETGKTCHEIIREFKSGFNTFIYQMIAKRYGYSLKETFNPETDADIEHMVQFLKSEGQLPIFTHE